MNNGTIVIKIVQDAKPGDTPQIDVTGKNEVEKTKRSDLETAAITTVIQRAWSSLKEMAASQIKFQVNRYFNITDNYLGQQSLNICLNVANKVKNVGESIIGGAIVAGAPGAIIMTAVEAGKLGLEIYQNYSEQNLQLRKMDAQLDYNRQRAGYSLTVGTQGENR